MPKISVVVPVYNLGDYIQACLESLKNQSFKDFEVIIVNDSSTDNSKEIISTFIKENSLNNFKLINQENRGPSSARNTGIDNSKGEWITFVDGDDWVEEHFLYELIKCTDKHSLELSIIAYRVYNSSTNTYTSKTKYTKEYGTLPDDLGFLYSFGKVWGRIYRTDILNEHNIRFDERIRYCEDNAFNFDYMSFVSGFYMNNTVAYNYRSNRNGSLTLNLIHPKVKYYVFDHMVDFYNKMDKVSLNNALKINDNLCFVMWSILHSAVVNRILDKDYHAAKKIKNSQMSKSIVKAYKPHTKKDKLFLFIWKISFWLTVAVSKLYYGNFERIRKSRFMKFISK